MFDFFLDDGKTYFLLGISLVSGLEGPHIHVRVGRWRVGFLSVTASESQKYRKRFKIPQNHKTKIFTQTKKYTSKSEELIPGRESGFAATAPLEIAARPTLPTGSCHNVPAINRRVSGSFRGNPQTFICLVMRGAQESEVHHFLR